MSANYLQRFGGIPEPHGLTLYLAKKYPVIHFDANDSNLLDSCYGVTVVFIYSGCPGVYPKQQMNGVVQDVTTDKKGVRWLLVKAEGLNIPKWIKLGDVQFLWEKKTPISVGVSASISAS